MHQLYNALDCEAESDYYIYVKYMYLDTLIPYQIGPEIGKSPFYYL